MTEGNGAASSVSAAEFQRNFPTVEPWIVLEWPAIDAGTLKATGGEFERVVDVVSERTKHTKALVRQKLGEILHVATAAPASVAGIDAQLAGWLARLEKFASELGSDIRGGVLPMTRAKLKENFLLTVLLAIGLGFVLARIFGNGARRER